MSLVFGLGMAIRQQTGGRGPLPPGPSAPPVNIALPAIAGTAQQGQVLTAETGVWMNSPTGYALQWWRGALAIAGATAASYVVQAADVGSAIGLTVTATNAVGSTAAAAAPTPAVTAAVAAGVTVIGLMGQSNIQYVLGADTVWDAIPTEQRPVIATPNMTWIGTSNGRLGSAGSDLDFEAWPVTTENASTLATRKVSASVANLSVVLNHIMPGRQFALVDLAVSGTGRNTLKTDGYSPARNWAEFEGIVEFARAQVGDFSSILEFWWASDVATMKSFGPSWDGFYMGQEWDGTPATLGVNGLDHMLWDITAAGGARGRGLFARDTTKLIISETRPDRTWADLAGPRAFAADSRVQTFMGHMSPGPLLGAWDGGHPLNNDPDGGIYTMHSWAVPILKAAGFAIEYPQVTGIETGPGGAWVDMLVTLPNGGNLTTVREVEARGAPSAAPPDYQPVMGVEVNRAGEADAARIPVVPVANTDKAETYRGTVAIIDAGTGTGAARRGRVRITPVVPFATGDRITYLKGYENMVANGFGDDHDRQTVYKVWLNYLIETVPAWRDTSAKYPFPGVAVAPSTETFVADTAPPPANAIGTPVLLANNSWASVTLNHETASFTPEADAAIYVIGAMTSALNSGADPEPVASATIGAPGRAAGSGTALVPVTFQRRSRSSLVIWRVEAPVAGVAQTVEIGYAASAPLAMRAMVVQIPHASSGAPVSLDSYNGSLGATARTMTPTVASAQNGVLYVLAKQNGDPANAIATADAPVLFEGDTGVATSATAGGRVLVGFEVPGAAGVQSTTISWPNSTSANQGAAVQVAPRD